MLEKSIPMLITTRERKKCLEVSDQTLQPSICEENAEVAWSTKLLGVQKDGNLALKVQIKSVTEKVSRVSGFLKYVKHFLPELVVKISIISLLSLTSNTAALFGAIHSQRLQNRAALIVTNSHSDAPSKSLIQSLGWKTIEQLINRQVNLMVFKCLNGISLKYLNDIFTKNTVDAARNIRNTKC